MANADSTGERTQLLGAARVALAQGRWAQAQTLFERLLALEESADALEGFAVARWWQDDVDAAIRARERAYVLRREQDQVIEAGRVAGFLAWDHGAMQGSHAVANGWLQRARRLTADLPASPEHAWLDLIEASFHLDTDSTEVLRLSTQAAAQAEALGGLDVEMTARTLQGLALVTLGRVEEGTRLLDEGTAAATSGELHDPIAIGSCCCNMIIACERSRDFDRAGQWCEQLEVYSQRTGQRPLLALCRAHHGTVLTERGEWAEADAMLTWAASELARLRPPLARYARVRLAQLRRRQGRLAEARKLVELARGHVLVSLVEAEVALDDGDPAAALGYVERYLRRLGGEQPIDGAAAFELLVPIHLSLGATERARQAHAGLAAIAEAVGTEPVRAAERVASARIALAEGDAAAACRAFEDAIECHRSSDSRFALAETQLALAHALVANDRPQAALDHALAAASTLEQLGAARVAKDAARLIARLGGRTSAARRAGLTGREVEVLRLVADGLSNPRIAERLVVSEHTVHRHLANIYAKLGVSSRAAAVALAAERELLV